MTKRKQATLFSLKSWKNVAAESLQKYKVVLSNHNETDSEILKALVSLRKKNPSKDVIISAGIDLSLELLERHQNPRISYEARMLNDHWQLNKNCTSEIVIDEEPPSKKRRLLPDIEICKIETTKKQTLTFKCNRPQATSNPEDTRLNKAVFMDTTKDMPLATTETTTLVFNTPSVNRATYSSIIRQLQDAVKLFTLELGEQEVRLYLENSFVSSSKLKKSVAV